MVFLLTTETAGAQPSKFWQWVSRTSRRFVNDSLPPDKPRFLVYPTLAYTPETSVEIGASSLLLFHAKNNFEQNRLSEVQAFTFVTLRNQYGIWLEHAIYGDQDRWFFLGRVRFQRFPLLYYGIGPETSGEGETEVDANSFQLRERVLRKIVPNFFVGVEMDYQKLYRVNFEQPEGGYPLGSEGSANLGLGAGLVYDNRHNVLNVRKGFFSEVAVLNYRDRWGSDYNFYGVNVDARLFRTVRDKQVLAWQLVGNFLSGEVPFNQLALLGNETLMRGYYTGRYRDKAYLASQVEYRWLPFPFSKRFGGAAFLAAGAVAPGAGEFRWKNVLPSGGVGLRYLVFPRKDIFLRVDVGFTREGVNFYVFSGEAF
ncbi:MAG: BamA/TamA family outer membrane protein [Ferruginibacter sp.]|nr:BamA/TamA family outer membrane protein [Cytophagales bacterium]